MAGSAKHNRNLLELDVGRRCRQLLVFCCPWNVQAFFAEAIMRKVMEAAVEGMLGLLLLPLLLLAPHSQGGGVSSWWQLGAGAVERQVGIHVPDIASGLVATVLAFQVRESYCRGGSGVGES